MKASCCVFYVLIAMVFILFVIAMIASQSNIDNGIFTLGSLTIVLP